MSLIIISTTKTIFMQNTDKVPKAPKKNPTVKELIDQDEKPYRAKVMICAMVDDMPHELGTAQLRSSKPFTKEALEKFIEGDQFVKVTRESVPAEYGDVEVRCIYIICNK